MTLRRTGVVLAVLGVLLVGLEIAVFDLYHEEPRRLLVAAAMLEEGRWWVPHVLGEIYLKKPPGFNWMVALFARPLGGVSRFAGRLVAAASWLGTGALVARAARELDDRAARWTAPAAFVFAPVVYLEKAGLAEIDLFFTFLLTAGVLLWYGLWRRGRPAAAWGVGHLFLGLALLSKGPVAYPFFYLPIGAWLWWREEDPRWGGLAAGFVLGHLPVILWAGAVFRTVEPGRYLEVAAGELNRSSVSGSWLNYPLLLLKYPLQILLSTLPWGLLGGMFLHGPTRRRTLRRLGGTPLGVLTAGGLFPLILYGLYPEDTVRYVLPSFPWLALLAGFVVDAAPAPALERGTRWILPGVSGLLVSVLWVYPQVAELAPSALSFGSVRRVSLVLAAGGVLLVGASWLRGGDPASFVAGSVAFAVLLKAAYVTVYLPAREPGVLLNRAAVDRFVQELPRGGRILRYNAGHHLEIPYYLRRHGFEVTRGETPSAGMTIVARPRHYRGDPASLRSFPMPDGVTLYAAVHGPFQRHSPGSSSP